MKIILIVIGCLLGFASSGFSQNPDDPFWLHMNYGISFLEKNAVDQEEQASKNKEAEFINEYLLKAGSRENLLELTLRNVSEEALAGLYAEITEKPVWIHVKKERFDSIELTGQGQYTLSFNFSVSDSVRSALEEEMTIVVSSPGGQSWTKKVRLKVEIPQEFELLDNYPNPFNPSTQITYRLPEQADVKVEIFNLLGQKVTTLVNAQQSAGSYTLNWNASGFSSGIYVYMITAEGISGSSFSETKKMMLIK